MAKKKFYAVRKGLKTGIFETWDECLAVTNGYSNAEFKSFQSVEEAEKYLSNIPNNEKNVEETFDMPLNKIIAYVDGSYDDKLKKYSFGCVILTPSGETFKEAGNGNEPDSLLIRNVAGEMLGAMYAVRWAITNGYTAVEIRYDYEGIEKWVTGEWKAKNNLAKKYAKAMNDWKVSIDISFLKIIAHSNNEYNDEADRLAKEALSKGNGIPKIKKGNYWFTVEGIKSGELDSVLELLKEEVTGLQITEKAIAHGKAYILATDKKDRVTVNYYNTKKLTVQGKPRALFSYMTTYITELVDIEDIPKIFNPTYKLDIDKNNIESEYQYYLPNSYDKISEKMSKVLHQAVYNLNINDDMFDGTFLVQPAFRVLEGHLKKILIEKGIVPDNAYIQKNHFNMFSPNGSKFQLKNDIVGDIGVSEINYINNCYTFYHKHRHVSEHWDDPTAPLDTTRLIDCNRAHELIKRTLELIDDYYTI